MAPWSVVAVLAVAVEVAELVEVSGRRVDNLYRHDDVFTARQTTRCGLVSERHEITSSDGYVTTVFRAHRRTEPPHMPVILQHDFLGNSDNWFLLGNESLPCMLSHLGYDIWLTNSRGNSYSKKHVKHPTGHDEFWLFSFHEMAVYDLSATVDYILNVTKKHVLSYVGDGMGGTMGIALFSSEPVYNDKINTAIYVSPNAVIDTGKDEIVTFITHLHHFMERHFVHWSAGELPAFTPKKTKSDRPSFLYVDLTMQVYAELLEMDSVDSTSFRTAAHISQLIRKPGNFARFDYKALNMEKYGQKKPPNYDIELIQTRQLILYGLDNIFVHYEDVKKLCKLLPEKWLECRGIMEPELRHWDFLTNPSAKQHVYSVILEELDLRRQEAEAQEANRRLG